MQKRCCMHSHTKAAHTKLRGGPSCPSLPSTVSCPLSPRMLGGWESVLLACLSHYAASSPSPRSPHMPPLLTHKRRRVCGGPGPFHGALKLKLSMVFQLLTVSIDRALIDQTKRAPPIRHAELTRTATGHKPSAHVATLRPCSHSTATFTQT